MFWISRLKFYIESVREDIREIRAIQSQLLQMVDEMHARNQKPAEDNSFRKEIPKEESSEDKIFVRRRAIYDENMKKYRLMTDAEAHAEEDVMKELGIL